MKHDNTFFRLKDGTDITIEGKDVQRICILNDVVWEKTRGTTLNVTSSPSLITKGKNFTLTATLTENLKGKQIEGDITIKEYHINDNNAAQINDIENIIENIMRANNKDFKGFGSYTHNKNTPEQTVDYIRYVLNKDIDTDFINYFINNINLDTFEYTLKQMTIDKDKVGTLEISSRKFGI